MVNSCDQPIDQLFVLSVGCPCHFVVLFSYVRYSLLIPLFLDLGNNSPNVSNIPFQQIKLNGKGQTQKLKSESFIMKVL